MAKMMATIFIIMFAVQLLLIWGGFAPGGTGIYSLFSPYIPLDPNTNSTQSMINESGTDYSSSSALITMIIAIFIASAGVGIAASFFGSSPTEASFRGVVAGFLIYQLTSCITMIAYVRSKANIEGIVPDPFAWVIIGIYTILMLFYIFAVVDWWGGND